MNYCSVDDLFIYFVGQRTLLLIITSFSLAFILLPFLECGRKEYTVSMLGISHCLVLSMPKPLSELLLHNSAWDVLHSFLVWKKESTCSLKQRSSVTSFLQTALLLNPEEMWWSHFSALSSTWTLPVRCLSHVSVSYRQISFSYWRMSPSSVGALFSSLVSSWPHRIFSV